MSHFKKMDFESFSISMESMRDINKALGAPEPEEAVAGKSADPVVDGGDTEKAPAKKKKGTKRRPKKKNGGSAKQAGAEDGEKPEDEGGAEDGEKPKKKRTGRKKKRNTGGKKADVSEQDVADVSSTAGGEKKKKAGRRKKSAAAKEAAAGDGESAGEDTLRKVLLLARHGARCPSEGALKVFAGLKIDEEHSPVAEWSNKAPGSLLNRGTDQLKRLGSWFAGEYVKGHHPTLLKSSAQLGWRSSPVERIRKSGDQFWISFEASMASMGTVIETPETPDMKRGDDLFRPWLSEAYQKGLKRVKNGKQFKLKSTRNQETIKRLREKVGLPTDEAEIPLTQQLYEMTYVWEIINCEQMTRKNALTSLLSEDDLEEIEDLARWVWKLRFFGKRFRKLGTALYKNIQKEVKRKKKKILFYGVHDFTILTLLASFGYQAYPGRVLGFGAFVLVEVHKKGEEEWVTVQVNSRPFKKSDGTPTRELQHDSLRPISTPLFAEGTSPLAKFVQPAGAAE